MTPARIRLPVLLPVLLVVGLVSAGVRVVNNLRIAAAPDAGGRAAWFATDPDSLYHMRRLERALEEGGRVATRDPLLDHPSQHAEGTPIPWPGHYTRVLWALGAPFAPAEAEARERFVEHAVATWPVVFGALTSVLAALAAGRLGGRTAAWIAGAYHALLFASLRYSHLGMGDHHAWTSLLHVAWLAAASEGLARLERPRAATAWGALAGLCAGLSLGSWVATLIAIVLFQVALVLGAVRVRGAGRSGLALLSAAFHGAALLVVLPEVALSPWPARDLINLSWMHAGVLALGLTLSLALAARGERRVFRVLLPLGALASLVTVLLGTGALAGGGVRAGWDWVTTREPFMALVNESRSLDAAGLVHWLGWGVVALPFAWLVLARARRAPLDPWLVAVPALAGMALLQRRFADGLGAPLAVLLGVAAAGGIAALGKPRRALPWLAVLLALAANPGRLRTTWNRATAAAWWVDTSIGPEARALRAACRWLRAQPAPGAVLAQWDRGHLIEWVARRPTLATNFGSYLGPRYLDPWRVLGAQDEDRVAALLEERDVRFVLLGADWRRNRVPLGAHSLDLERSLAARLVPRGQAGRDPGLEDLGTLRLVLVSPRVHPSGRADGAGCWVYERVQGAVVEARGEPGANLRVGVTLRFGEELIEWSAAAEVGPDGLGRLRVPHATDAPSGAGRPRGPARWSLGAVRGELEIPVQAVLEGGRLVLP